MSETTDLAATERPYCRLMGLFYVLAGAMHFVAPRLYEQVVPPELPRPRALVYLSGAAEVVLGIGVMLPRTRRVSAWGIVALLAAVFPANLHVAVRDVEFEGVPAWARDPPDWVALVRLPVQGLLALWALRYARDPRGTAPHEDATERPD